MSRAATAAVAVALAVAGPASGTALEERCAAIAAARGRDADPARLHALFDAVWDWTLREHPEYATQLGIPGHDDRWTDRSPEAIARRERELDAPAAALATIDRDALSPADRLSLDVFRHDLEQDLAGRRFPDELLAISPLHGPQHDVPRVLAATAVADVAGYEHVLARLAALPRLLSQVRTLLERGLATGITPPRSILGAVPEQVGRLLADDPLQSPLLAPFAHFPERLPAAARERLRARAVASFRTDVAPAVAAFRTWLADVYVPGARSSTALSALPDGAAWYAWAARAATTTDLTPDRLHRIGLGEVARIRRAMHDVVRRSGVGGDLAGFVRHLRTDPRFFFQEPDALLAAYRDIAKRADPALVRLFGRLPRLPYGIAAVPAHVERSQPAAYYERGSLASGRPAWLFANTSDLPSRPRWQMEALVLHEAVPGHHLQIALAGEMEAVPPFRRHATSAAFVEGWALYAEGLGDAMGFYQDPYSKFGQLSFEMWRAVRLVVDTGLHTRGWTREQAIAYLAEQAGKSEREATVEIDRYLAWPAQALAYKIGQLRIAALRHEAERRLGARFDLRAFHDAVLAEGALPLDILAAHMDGWLRARERQRR